MYKNIASTFQAIERVQRDSRAGPWVPAADPGSSPAPRAKLGLLQKIIAFGPLPT
jgi:hypothetical protein